ncbi:MAG: hypothetical protein QMD10_10160 [Desulfitobacteriaceae bacterium]|nr:hypothetical protein [Desulfitobacteriaceae bacterium]
MKLTIRYVRSRIPVEVCMEAPGLEPGRACELFQYIVARLDAAVSEALPKIHGGRGVQLLEANTPRPTAAAPAAPDNGGEPQPAAERRP